MGRVLTGTKVLDFGRYISAPWCAALLGDLGAEVIRVERREGGEDRWVTPLSSNGEGAMFLQCNRNKQSLSLDPTTPEGAEIAPGHVTNYAQNENGMVWSLQQLQSRPQTAVA